MQILPFPFYYTIIPHLSGTSDPSFPWTYHWDTIANGSPRDVIMTQSHLAFSVMVRHPMIPMNTEILPSTSSASVYDTWLLHATIPTHSQTWNCGSSVHVDVLKRQRHLCSVLISNRNCLEILGGYLFQYTTPSSHDRWARSVTAPGSDGLFHCTLSLPSLCGCLSRNGKP
jgi:hypothetical protein